jgi:hypothetical protein
VHFVATTADADVRLTPEELGKIVRIVSRMVKLAAPQITTGEARQISCFLSTEYGPDLNRSGVPLPPLVDEKQFNGWCMLRVLYQREKPAGR